MSLSQRTIDFKRAERTEKKASSSSTGIAKKLLKAGAFFSLARTAQSTHNGTFHNDTMETNHTETALTPVVNATLPEWNITTSPLVNATLPEWNVTTSPSSTLPLPSPTMPATDTSSTPFYALTALGITGGVMLAMGLFRRCKKRREYVSIDGPAPISSPGSRSGSDL